MIRSLWAIVARTAPFLLLSALLLAPGAVAQTPDGVAADTPQEATDELTKKERKRQAREDRIAEYLRKKEEKRARREIDSAGTVVVTSEPATSGAPASSAAPTSTVAATKAPAARPRSTRLPRGLAKAQEQVRNSELGLDPTVQDYLDLIDQQGASPQQLAAFANFIADNGMPRTALEYYAVALRLEPDDPILWVNVGTLHRQLNDMSGASNAYTRALQINPNNAMAHYNLGAIKHFQGKYEEAIAEYKIALTLDPTLGDATYNPQAANNELLVSVKMMLYQEQSGSLGLPLMDVPTTRAP